MGGLPPSSDTRSKLESGNGSTKSDRYDFEKTESVPRLSAPSSAIACATAAEGGRRRRIFSTAWPVLAVHALSATTTIGMVTVYMIGVVWDPSAAEINALLVASKVYEWLILGSLGDIVLHLVRAALARPRGIALGLLASPFQLTSGCYLLGRQLWKAAAKPTRSSRGDETLTIQILSLLVLAMAIGPSTGILMLPKLDWWGFPKNDVLGPYQVQELVGALIVDGNYESFYPSRVGSDLVNPSCSSAVPTAGANCPATALGEIQEEIDDALDAVLKLDNLNEFLFNYTVSQPSHPRSISLGWQFEQSPRPEAVVYATSPLDLVTDALHREASSAWRQQGHSPVKVSSTAVVLKEDRWIAQSPFPNVSYSDTPWRQPVVVVHCTEAERRDGADTAIFAAIPPFPALPPVSLGGIAAGVPKEDSVRFTDPPPGSPENVSAAVVWRSANATALCYIGAKWAASDVWITKPADLVAESDLSVDPYVASGRFDDTSNLVTLSPEWANNGLGPALLLGELGSNLTRTRALCTEAYMPRCIAISLSLYLTDALSRLSSPDKYSCKWAASQPGSMDSPRSLDCEKRSGEEQNREITITYLNLTQFTGVSFSYHSYRYAYGFGGIAEGFAFLGLLCHLVAVLLHVLEHYIRNNTYGQRGWTDIGQRGWTDIGELVVAFIRRSSPELVPNHNAGRYCSEDTWKLRVLVQRDTPVDLAEIRIERHEES